MNRKWESSTTPCLHGGLWAQKEGGILMKAKLVFSTESQEKFSQVQRCSSSYKRTTELQTDRNGKEITHDILYLKQLKAQNKERILKVEKE